MLRVLLVEDEEIIRKGLVYSIDWLSMSCLLVGVAADGVEGLEKLESTACDVVIADIKMPRMGGIEMLETAAALGITGFKAVLLTSYAEFEYARKAIELQVVDYLLKPVDQAKLRETMRRIEQDQTEEKLRREVPVIVDLKTYQTPEIECNSYVTYALKRIQEGYSHKLSLEQVADECKVSVSYLGRAFKLATSQTFLELLNRYRVQQAVNLMTQGELKVYEISDRTGLGDYKHFHYVFKKCTGISPTEFMQNLSAGR